MHVIWEPSVPTNIGFLEILELAQLSLALKDPSMPLQVRKLATWRKSNNHEKLKLCLGRLYHFKFFKGCLSQSLLGPFLNTLTHFHSIKIDILWILFISWDQFCHIYFELQKLQSKGCIVMSLQVSNLKFSRRILEK